MMDYILSASILSADMARLGKAVQEVVHAGADFIHIDVMDNHYVPNLTFGPLVVTALRDYGITVPLDVHLMVKPVDALIPQFAKAGADYISFHPEASEHIDRSLQLIVDQGCKAGLALNPTTPLDYLEYTMDRLDLILLMSVNPGFANQCFIDSTLTKLPRVRRMIDQSDRAIRLQVDGGIKVDNIRHLAMAGADTFVVGSAIFDSHDYHATILAMRERLK